MELEYVNITRDKNHIASDWAFSCPYLGWVRVPDISKLPDSLNFSQNETISNTPLNIDEGETIMLSDWVGNMITALEELKN